MSHFERLEGIETPAAATAAGMTRSHSLLVLGVLAHTPTPVKIARKKMFAALLSSQSSLSQVHILFTPSMPPVYMVIKPSMSALRAQRSLSGSAIQLIDSLAHGAIRGSKGTTTSKEGRAYPLKEVASFFTSCGRQPAGLCRDDNKEKKQHRPNDQAF
jgi:hypothetical protein